MQAAAAGVHCSNYRAFAAQQVGYMLGDAGRYPINQACTAFAVLLVSMAYLKKAKLGVRVSTKLEFFNKVIFKALEGGCARTVGSALISPRYS